MEKGTGRWEGGQMGITKQKIREEKVFNLFLCTVAHDEKGAVVLVSACIVAGGEDCCQVTACKEQVTLIHYLVCPDDELELVDP